MAELLPTMRQDLRFAIRQLRKSPHFTLTAIVVFALGIAASTDIFAFVDAALVKPLPYRDPGRLVAIYERIPVGDRYHISVGDYLDLKRLNRTLTSLAVYRPDRFAFKTASGAEEVSGARVSDAFFRTLGVAPFLGRDFRPGEDLPSAQQAVLLSYETWRNRFSADKNVLGRTITLDGDASLIVGVLPPGFHFAPVASAGYWATLHWLPQGDDLRGGHPYYGVARLKQGVSVAIAYADLASIMRQIAIDYPHSNRDRSATVLPLGNAILGDVQPTLMALLAGAALLSFIGFVNVSSLLLVRAESRRREIAVRGALGASRTRLVFQFAVEGFLLAGSGCVFGLALTIGSLRILLRQVPRPLLTNMPYLQDLHFGVRLLLFATLVSALGGILFSAGPAVQLFLSDMQEGLMEGGRTAAGRGWRRLGATLVVVELAITVVLLVSAGLLAKSFYRLLHEDIGMSADHLAMLHILSQGNPTDAQSVATERKIRYRLAGLPGVVSVADSGQPAIASGEGYTLRFAHFRVVGRTYPGEGDEARQNWISFGYFETLRAKLLQGRYFTEHDDGSAPRVAILNRTMVKQAFAGEDPLGKSIVNEYDPDHPFTVAGVVDDIQDGPLDSKPTPAIYASLTQNPTNDFYVTLRTSQSPETMLPTMVNTVHQIDANLIADDEDTMTARIDDSQSAYLHRSAAWVVGAFAALALLLGTVGLYGVISYSVGQRTREIGVRMALGAQRPAVYQMILKEACWLTVLGIGGGILGSAATASLLRSMLFGVSPWDRGTMLAVVCVLAAATLLASYLPARRAASINPTEALRAE
jgi:macrolide transport system ATP-binding/permease protein